MTGSLLTRARSGDPAAIDRCAAVLLGLASAASVALILWLNRGTTFFFDELVWFADLSSYSDPSAVLEPHNSHLHGTTRIVYYVAMEIFGTDYAVIRVLGVSMVVPSALLFYRLAKRRVGTPAALGIAILLLFYGSAWQHVVGPIGFTVVGSATAGLAALLALERDDRRGDLAACALIWLSVFTFTVGLAFLVGVAVAVLLRADRLRRAWIFLVPLILYFVWWLWALQFDQGRATAANFENVPEFFARSLAVVVGGLTGLNIPFSRFGEMAVDEGVTVAPASILGWIAAIVFVAALARRFRRGSVPRSLYASIAIVCTYWLAAALAEPIFFGTQATSVRYVYPGSIGVLLVATDAARGLRIPPRAGLALLALFVFSLCMNLVFLSDGATSLRTAYSPTVRANLAMVELSAGGRGLAGEASVRTAVSPDSPPIPYGPAGSDYIRSVERYGSPAFTLEQLRTQPGAVREGADLTLGNAYGLAPRSSLPPARRSGCRLIEGAGAHPLPEGGPT